MWVLNKWMSIFIRWGKAWDTTFRGLLIGLSLFLLSKEEKEGMWDSTGSNRVRFGLLVCSLFSRKRKRNRKNAPNGSLSYFLSEGTEKRGNCGMLLFILLIFCFFFSLCFFASCRRQSVLDCIGVRVCRMKPKTCSFFSKKPRKETKKKLTKRVHEEGYHTDLCMCKKKDHRKKEKKVFDDFHGKTIKGEIVCICWWWWWCRFEGRKTLTRKD